MPHHELIERGRRSHQHGARASAAASRTAGALPRCRNRAGIACHDHGVERADVNSQLQSARCDHAADFSLAQAALDFSSFVGQVAAAVSPKFFRFPGQTRIRLLQIGEEYFRVQP